MSKKHHKKSNNYNQEIHNESGLKWHHALQEETKRSIAAIVFFVLAALSILSYWGEAGIAGKYVYDLLTFLFGKGYVFMPISLVLIGFSFIFSARAPERNSVLHKHVLAAIMIGGVFALASSLGLMNIAFGEQTAGIIGFGISYPFIKFFDFWASLIILAAVLFTSFLILFNVPLWINYDKRKNEQEPDNDEDTAEEAKEIPLGKTVASLTAAAETMKAALGKIADNYPHTQNSAELAEKRIAKSEEDMLVMKNLDKHMKKIPYTRPPLDLLQSDKGAPSSGDIRANSNIIQRTLQSFGINVEMGEVSVGPTVTQYTLKPAEGVKISKITALNSNLALALAAHPIRIEAPIPGKSFVGIEIPNRSIALVGLRALMEASEFQNGKPLSFCLGRDVAGVPIYADLSKMPHLLVAGATGSGKSVNIHTIIASFLYKNPPEILKLIMIDPKRVELSLYNGIPHLLNPVITDPKKAIMALRWATQEMENRYQILADAGVRDIAGYNAEITKAPEGKIMPYITVIVDELADLMLTYPREVEAAVVRLAQMARAVGIHLIISTQRPSVEVITGLIKANITSRIALQVASQIDSRTILDMPGAEKLLGHGDMLFMAGDTGKPKRIQGAFISEGEVKKIVKFVSSQNETTENASDIAELPKSEEFTLTNDLNDDINEDTDPMYNEAKTVVIQASKASTSLLQRRLGLGYGRAAKIIDMLEENGVIGPANGSKPREVLIANDSPHQYEEMSEEAKFMREHKKDIPEEI